MHFIELPPLPEPERPGVRPDTEIDLQRADGARLHLRGGDATLPLAALVRAFLEAH